MVGRACARCNAVCPTPPLEGEGFDALHHAMSRFLLKDGSVTVEPESSPTLGQGLRCGFLGLLHLEVTS